MERQRATEIKFLKWFYSYADFGPADGGVRDMLKDQFEEETGLSVPEGYDERS